MSEYRIEWPCCGEITITYAWEPTECPFCEVRRLREENERLLIENIALKADADRINWLADVNNTVGSVVLPREIVESNITSLRQAIDAARSAK